MKRSLLILLMLCGALSAFAKKPDSRYHTRPPFYPQHDVRLSVGWAPVGHNKFVNEIGEKYRAGSTSGIWALSYTYHIDYWLELGGSLSYYGEYSTTSIGGNNKSANRNSFAILPTARFTWLNREWVRLYSSIGLGLELQSEHNTNRDGGAHFGWQAVPVGVTVGKSFFGFAELGVGTLGFARVGIGYKFNRNQPNNRR